MAAYADAVKLERLPERSPDLHSEVHQDVHPTSPADDSFSLSLGEIGNAKGGEQGGSGADHGVHNSLRW